MGVPDSRSLNSNGSRKWQFTTRQRIHVGPTVGQDSSVYIGVYDGIDSSYLYALNPGGATKWRYKLPLNQTVGGTCIVDGAENIYFLVWSYDTGEYYLYGLGSDGTFKFGKRSSSFVNQTPVIGQGNVLWGMFTVPFQGASLRQGSSDGTIASSASLVIRANAPGGVITERMTGPVLLGDGPMLVGLEEAAFALLPSEEILLSALLAVDSSGAVKWRFLTPARISSSPAVSSNGTAYFGCLGRKLYAVAGAAGPAKSPWPMYRKDTKRTGAVSNSVLDHLSLGVNVYAGLAIKGNVGASYRIEFSEKVPDTWQPLATVTLDRTPYLFFDIESTNSTKRFYRAVQLP